jgi:hypothetical protein
MEGDDGVQADGLSVDGTEQLPIHMQQQQQQQLPYIAVPFHIGGPASQSKITPLWPKGQVEVLSMQQQERLVELRVGC